MSFAPQGVSPFLPGNNYMKVDFGVKKEVDRSLILRKKNNKVNYRKCTDDELLELLKKNEKLLSNKALVEKLPDKGEKIHLKNEEIKDEINRRNITIETEKKDNANTTTTNNKENNNEISKDTVKENDKDIDNDKMTESENSSTKDTMTEDNSQQNSQQPQKGHAMEIEDLNEKMKTINISDGNDNEETKKSKPKHGQARVAEMILKNAKLNDPTFMIPHNSNKGHPKFISIEESIEIQTRQRKLQKEIEIEEARKRLERTIMSTGPVKYHSNEYRNNKNDDFDDSDDTDDDDDDSNSELDIQSNYDSSDAEADNFLFGPRH